MLNTPLLHTSVGISCFISLEANQGKNVTVAWSTQLSHSDVNLKLKKAKLFSIKPFSTKIVSKLLWRGEISENFDACSHDEMVLGYIIYVWSVTLLGLQGRGIDTNIGWWNFRLRGSTAIILLTSTDRPNAA